MNTKTPSKKPEEQASGQEPAVRSDVVDFFKKKIAGGDYGIKSNEIAEKIVQKLREQPTKVGSHNIGGVF